MIRTVLSALALALAAATASVSAAAPAQAQDLVTINVSYADLNLSNTAGAAVLQRRIDAAVGQICGRADNRDLEQRAAVAQCRAEVSIGADEQSRQAIAKARQTLLAAAPQAPVFAVR
jgi:UrcA family protein